MCLGLQRADREVLEHAIVKRLPHGEFVEVHQPLAREPLEHQGAPVPKKMSKLGTAGAPVPGSLLRPDPPSEAAELERARERSR